MIWWECVHGGGRARETPASRRSAGIGGPGRRWGHTCNAGKGGKLLYVFGGYGCDNSQTNDVHIFDASKKTWIKPLIQGTPPSPRDSHSCTTVGNRLFVFGGTDGTNPLKDLHVFDTSSNTWIVPAVSGEGPEAREGHSATLVDKRLFIFGGCGKSNDTHQEVYFNDLYILDTENLIWKRVVTSGTPPSPRDSHTCSAWNKKIIVLGGEDASDCYLSDVYMLDAETLVWEQVNTSGQMLAPRAGHTTVVLGSNLFVFGGFTDARNLYDDLHVLNVGTSTWRRVETLNQGPSARFSVAGDCLDERRGIIVFIGGCNKHLKALDDMYYLHAGMLGENGLAEPKLENPSLRRVLNKCRENNLAVEEPEKNNNMNVESDLSNPVYLQGCSQAGILSGGVRPALEVTFEARITDVRQNGYTIETTIDGKLLRGMLFSTTASSNQDGHTYPNKRRTVTDTEDGKLNGQQPLLNTDQLMSQEDKDHEKIAPLKESASKATHMEILLTGLTHSIPPPENVETLLYSSSCKSEYLEPSKVSFVDIKHDSAHNVSHVHDPKNEIQILESLSIPLEGSKSDSKELDLAPIPTEDLVTVSGNLEPTQMLTDISDELEKIDAGCPCEIHVADNNHYPCFQVKDMELQTALEEPEDHKERLM